MDLSIVVPCYNEEGSLPLLFSAVDDAFATSGVSYELVLVNDGSSDGTSHLLHELPTPASAERIVVVDFSRNFGKESALLAGLQHAEGDAVGLMDADLQQPPATLLEMYRMLQANPSADCVAAFQEHRNEGAVLSFFKHAFYKTFDATSRLNVMPDASDFRVFHRRVADALLSMPESFRFSKGMFAWVGFETLPFPYTPANRVEGETKWSFRKLMRYGIGGVLSFTTFPLKIAAVAGSRCHACRVGSAGRSRCRAIYQPRHAIGLSYASVRAPFDGRAHFGNAGCDRRIHRTHLHRNQAPPSLYREIGRSPN